eukprot:scaffold255359_cov37-Tisochrysis_lutea.AAC.1
MSTRQRRRLEQFSWAGWTRLSARVLLTRSTLRPRSLLALPNPIIPGAATIDSATCNNPALPILSSFSIEVSSRLGKWRIRFSEVCKPCMILPAGSNQCGPIATSDQQMVQPTLQSVRNVLHPCMCAHSISITHGLLSVFHFINFVVCVVTFHVRIRCMLPAAVSASALLH